MKKLPHIIIAAAALLLCGCQCQPSCEFAITTPAEISQAQNQIKADVLFITAMPSERKFVEEAYSLKEIAPGLHAANGVACITTGIGGANVNATLKKFKVSEGVKKINVGYCGSNVIEKGKLCKVSSSAKIENPQARAKIAESGVPCFTADKFVEETDIKEPCVFDMELFYIQKIFPDIAAYKIVSDNLSHSEFKNFESLNPQEAWNGFLEEISNKIAKKPASPAKNN